MIFRWDKAKPASVTNLVLFKFREVIFASLFNLFLWIIYSAYFHDLVYTVFLYFEADY